MLNPLFSSIFLFPFSLLNYGLTLAAKGQEGKVRELDAVLEKFNAFKVEKEAAVVEQGWWGTVAREVSPEEMKGEKKEEVEKSAAAYWTTLAPNVEEYSGSVAKLIAAGSGQLVRGILWCGDVTVDRLKWGNEFLTKRMGKGSSSEVSPQALRRLKRMKQMTKMPEKVATGLLSGVVKVSGFFTSSVVNSAVGKKFFSLLPGEIILASLDGFSREGKKNRKEIIIYMELGLKRVFWEKIENIEGYNVYSIYILLTWVLNLAI
ncbi:senescence/dehydration-associated protein At4g35985, chloroplastic-like [Salvia splendens]|uniref:senescence/dehydration-associated protein At4g35985, chloroplastic-like n=1 Tax=Salvia splendens TaxID=180675 RepID=UPI001C25E981|nr:senescence/dehydration-associated protein At4g35985, chloroplastic-like [Salvia splendens]